MMNINYETMLVLDRGVPVRVVMGFGPFPSLVLMLMMFSVNVGVAVHHHIMTVCDIDGIMQGP